MSGQRYPPPRDRSPPPPRQFDRRSSNTYTTLPTSSSYRPNNEPSQTSIDRPPPRGPRADSFRGTTFPFTPAPRGRGTGFQSRGGDSWDRESDRDRERDRDRDRDTRATSSTFRRDDDRSDWTRRDRDAVIPDRGPTFSRARTHVGRERSASPIRPRRDSKDNGSTAFGRSSEAGSTYFNNAPRGSSIRGRGRGDVWDRSRGRTSFIGDRDRDLFPNRSRSREGRRDRDRDHDRNRIFIPEPDRNDRFDRRDYDRPIDRDVRGRDHDIWPRDQSPSRSSIGNRGNSPSAMSSVSQDRAQKFDYDAVRKPTASTSIPPPRDARRDTDSDHFASRNEVTRRDPPFQQSAPPQSQPQSASVGLDYGPPPTAPAVSAVSAVSTIPPPLASIPPAPEKAHSYRPLKSDATPTNISFQPPSGPKAERAPQSFNNNLSQSQISSSEPRSKIDIPAQQQRHSSLDSLGKTAIDAPKAQNDPTVDYKQPISTQQDRPLPANVPSGPRMASGNPYKPRTSPVVPQTALSPNLSHQSKPLSIDARGIPNAPTGPRNISVLAPSGPRASLPAGPSAIQSGPAPASWRRPQIEYRPSKPSIMNTLIRPHGADRAPPATVQLSPKVMARPSIVKEYQPSRDLQTSKEIATQDPLSSDHVKKEQAIHMDIDIPRPVSEDDAEDEEDEEETYEDDGLDEDYFTNSEKTHLREMELLRSRKPPPLLNDPNVITLLMRIQLLGIIAEGLVPEGIHATMEDVKETKIQQPSVQVPPSPDDTPEHSTVGILHHPQPRGRPLKQVPVNPIPTPPIEDLPFLVKSNAEELVIFDEPAEDEVEDEAVTMLLRQQFEHAAWDERADLQDLYEFYRQKYPEWKYEIDRLERLRRELHEPTPDPGSPGGQSSTSVPPSAERLTSRAVRNATEFDIEKAILRSQQSAKEEEERREREAASNALPNYDVEAVVPDMLRPLDRDPFWRFQDTNWFVPTNLAVELMQYIPPEDDFTEEEQRSFISAFCQTPKKWGLIADHIPGRSYQECIAHYYLTKNEARYKDIWRRSQPKRKRGRAATKPRSTALLSDMALNEDNDGGPVAVTDSGRPRRAAAPTFGDTPDTEASITLPAAKRIALGPKELSEGAVPKTTKGRKAGTATKTRRTKAQIQADNQAHAMQTNVEGSPVKNANNRGRTLLQANNMSAKSHSILSNGVPKLGDTDPGHLVNAPLQGGPTTLRARSPPVPMVTSYWSVPEQHKFKQLVAYYGRDYAKIADFMKTKSQAMIKNNYGREITKGDTELERLAKVAEDKLARGESMGRAPSPIVPPKRKYESTTALPPHGSKPFVNDTIENVGLDKLGVVQEFSGASLHREANNNVVAKASPRHDFLSKSPHHTPIQTKMEETGRDRPLLPQKGLPGPQRGHFTASDNSSPPFSISRPRQLTNHANPEHILHHHPPQFVDLRGSDVPLGALLANTREPVAQPRDALVHAQHTQMHQTLSQDRPHTASSRHVHSRNGSIATANSALLDPAAELLALRNPEPPRRINYSTPTTQSPRSQPLQTNLPPRQEFYAGYSSQPVAKPEPPKPAPAKRSNVFSILNDDPPEPPSKRLSTDSHRTSIQTPPPQPATTQSSIPQPAHQQRLADDVLRRQHHGAYNTGSPHVTPSDNRNTYANSPAPAPAPSWLDRFDPRSSPSLYSVVPPNSQVPTTTSQQTVSDGLRPLEPSSGRRSHLGMSQVSSPPRQVSTPVSQFRPASAAPQHSRMSSLGYGQGSQTNIDSRPSHQSQQQQHLQPPGGHSSSSAATPMSSLHHRGPSSLNYDPKRLAIHEHKPQQNHGHHSMEQQESVDRQNRHRFAQDDLLPSSQRDQHRHMPAPPPTVTVQQDHHRQTADHGDPFRKDNPNHNVPPPPARSSQTSQLGHMGSMYGNPPPRTYTPPLGPYGSDPRGMSVMHNQHAHHHHHNISAQSQQQQSLAPQGQSNGPGSSSSYMHHQQQQQQLAALPPQPLANLPHQSHQQQNQPPQHHLTNQQQQQQQQQQQSRFGPQSHGLAPPNSSYRQFGSDDRR